MLFCRCGEFAGASGECIDCYYRNARIYLRELAFTKWETMDIPLSQQLLVNVRLSKAESNELIRLTGTLSVSSAMIVALADYVKRSARGVRYERNLSGRPRIVKDKRTHMVRLYVHQLWLAANNMQGRTRGRLVRDIALTYIRRRLASQA